MPCERTPDGGFICSRGSRAARCEVEGCGKPSTKQCDYPLRGPKTGKTCSRYLCDAHAIKQGDVTRIDDNSTFIKEANERNTPLGRVGSPHYNDTVDFCPTHHELAMKHAKKVCP